MHEPTSGKTGRDDRFVELLTGVQQRLTRYIRTLVPNRTDADEVLQETNLYLWRHAEEYQWGTNFAAWACKTAYYHVLTYRKHQARDRLHFSDALVEQLSRAAAPLGESVSYEVEAFESCMAKLPVEDRELIELRYQPEATVQTVAVKLGRTPKAVYHALARIRLWLLECMQRAISERRRQ